MNFYLSYNLYNYSFYLIVPEFFLFFSIIFLTFFGIYFSTKLHSKKFLYLTDILIINTLILLIYYFLILSNIFNNNFSIFNSVIISSDYIQICKKFIVFLFFLFFIAYWDYVKNSGFDIYEINILLLVVLLAFSLLVSSNNFLTLYLIIELYNLVIYSIIALKKNSKKAVEASIKYFVYGSFSSGLMLLSISLIYGFTGMTNFSDLEFFFWLTGLTNFSVFISLSVTLLTLSFLFKLGSAPFHIWVIEVYDGSPLIFTFFLTLFTKLVLMIFLIRFYLTTVFIFYILWKNIFIIFIVLSLIVGVGGSIFHLKLKKIFIYSSIFSSGFFLIPFFLINFESLSGLLLFISIYSINLVSLFLFLLNFRDLSLNFFSNSLMSFSGFFSYRIICSFFFLINLLSLAGIPPFAGFFGKFFLLFSFVNSNYLYLFILFNLVNLIGLFYYLRLLKLFILTPLNLNSDSFSFLFLRNPSKIISLILTFIFLFNVSFIFFSKFIVIFFHELIFFIF